MYRLYINTTNNKTKDICIWELRSLTLSIKVHNQLIFCLTISKNSPKSHNINMNVKAIHCIYIVLLIFKKHIKLFLSGLLNVKKQTFTEKSFHFYFILHFVILLYFFIEIQVAYRDGRKRKWWKLAKDLWRVLYVFQKIILFIQFIPIYSYRTNVSIIIINHIN